MMPSRQPTAPYFRSKKRVADHGEVFTPDWIADKMLDLVKTESERIDSRVLEPACGAGTFLLPALRRKLRTVEARYRKNAFDRHHQALLALMCIYGVELLADNVRECRVNLLNDFIEHIPTSERTPWRQAAAKVLEVNIVHADALTMRSLDGYSIVFPEWSYIGRGRYQRRDFRYEVMTQRSTAQIMAQSNPGAHELFTPIRTFKPMSVKEIAT